MTRQQRTGGTIIMLVLLILMLAMSDLDSSARAIIGFIGGVGISLLFSKS